MNIDEYLGKVMEKLKTMSPEEVDNILRNLGCSLKDQQNSREITFVNQTEISVIVINREKVYKMLCNNITMNDNTAIDYEDDKQIENLKNVNGTEGMSVTLIGNDSFIHKDSGEAA